MTANDPELRELANLSFALDAVKARRDEAIRRIAARGRRGDQRAMAELAGLHRQTVAAIAHRTPQSVKGMRTTIVAPSSPSASTI